MTAVEKYIKGLKNYKELDMNIDAAILLAETVLLSLEKQQIISANRDGVDMVVDKKPFITGEEYYNETFKKD